MHTVSDAQRRTSLVAVTKVIVCYWWWESPPPAQYGASMD
jgi:hypothetical protein